ncbi:MAG: hypothetical protein J5639_03195 [Bacteroidales bacterium]|nr:hypothetical protein [Bacteroidales bacterium]
MSRCLFAILCGVLLFCPGCSLRSVDRQSDSFGVTFVIDGGNAGAGGDDPTGPTRATAAADETAVGDACLYFVNLAGAVVDAVSVSGNTVFRNFETGTYKAYYVANCGLGGQDFTSESGINAFVRSLASETGAFSMFAVKTFSVPEDKTCSLAAERLVSKVEIDKISTDFSRYPDLAAQTFTIDSIYLVNVAGESTLADGTAFIPAASAWINRQRYAASSADVLLCDVVRQTVTAARPHSVPHYFYCYQNNVGSDTHSKTWSARYTRLVVACTLGTTKTYYPIDIAGPQGRLSRNCRYVINELVITDLGSDAPDNEITGRQPFRFSVSVKDWEGNHTISERF